MSNPVGSYVPEEVLGHLLSYATSEQTTKSNDTLEEMSIQKAKEAFEKLNNLKLVCKDFKKVIEGGRYHTGVPSFNDSAVNLRRELFHASTSIKRHTEQSRRTSRVIIIPSEWKILLQMFKVAGTSIKTIKDYDYNIENKVSKIALQGALGLCPNLETFKCAQRNSLSIEDVALLSTCKQLHTVDVGQATLDLPSLIVELAQNIRNLGSLSCTLHSDKRGLHGMSAEVLEAIANNCPTIEDVSANIVLEFKSSYNGNDESCSLEVSDDLLLSLLKNCPNLRALSGITLYGSTAVVTEQFHQELARRAALAKAKQ